MPTPKAGESRDDFASRCISAKIKEGKHPNTPEGRKKAAGECYGIYDGWKKKKRSLTLREISSIVSGAWEGSFGQESPYSWCEGVYEEYVIIRMSGKFIQIPWTMEKQEVTFDLESAQLVEHQWTPSERRLIPSAIRAVEGDVYQCYGMLFGDPEHRDAYGTWFDSNTEYCLDWYETLPWLYHHTHNRFIGTRKIGDWTERGIDDKGVFFKGELDLRQEYLDEVKLLLDDEQILFPSSGTLAYAASPPQEDGYIAVWPIVELTSTVAPADFRQKPISQEAAEAIRTLRR